MPEKQIRKRAGRTKSPSSKAGEFVREEIRHVREGKHGARNAKQVIAIGLSKARRAGIRVPAQGGGKATGSKRSGKTNPRRSRATSSALKREGSSAASHRALSSHSRSSARQRGSASRSAAARQAVQTKGAAGRKKAAAKWRNRAVRTDGTEPFALTE